MLRRMEKRLRSESSNQVARIVVMALLATMLVGCECSTPVDPDAGDIDAGADARVTLCASGTDCDDGMFCNGPEACAPGSPDAARNGCVPGEPPCGVDDCDEAEDTCVCSGDPDRDGDGHDSVACGGDDCDDEDPTRYPGLEEVCDAAGHDEDCDSSTLAGSADGDRDGDGFVSITCCNAATCGDDCNDDRAEVNPDVGELCNARDDDCDGAIDEAGAFCPVGMCMSSRCRSVPWERVFGAADEDAFFGLAVDSAGIVYVGINLDADTDLDGDGTAEPFGAYLVALEADGRFRFVAAVGLSGVDLTVTKNGTDVVIATPSELAFHSTVDGSLTSRVFYEVAGATVSEIRAVGTTEAGVVAALAFREAGTPEMLELVLVDGAGAELARRRFEGTLRFYELHGMDAQDRYVALIADTDGPYDLAASSVNGRHVLVLTDTLDPVWARSTFAEVDVAVSQDGGAAIVGRFSGTLAPPWTTNTWTSVGEDAYLTVFSPAGEAVYTRVHTGPGSVSHRGIAFDGRAALFEAGSFGGSLPMPPRGTLGPSVGGNDAFYAHVDATTDFTLDALAVSGPRFEAIVSIRADPFGALIVLGTFGRDGITLPSGTFYASVGRNNLFLLRVASF